MCQCNDNIRLFFYPDDGGNSTTETLVIYYQAIRSHIPQDYLLKLIPPDIHQSYYSIVKMVAAGASETWATICQIARLHITEENNIQNCRHFVRERAEPCLH